MVATEARPAKTILVVEDDPTIRDLIALLLEGEGFEAVPVRDGQQALRAARDLHPDAITLDLDLPGIDGLAFLDRLRDDPETRRVPVVVVSAASESLSHPERHQVARALRKPFQVRDLLSAVSRAVAEGR